MITKKESKVYRKRKEEKLPPEVEEALVEYQQKEQSGKKDNKKKRRTIAIALVLGIATGSVGGHFAYKGILNNQDAVRASRLTEAFQSKNVCILTERVFTYDNLDYEYTTGEHLIEACEGKNIDILRVGNLFVTPNGERVARVIKKLDVTISEPIHLFTKGDESFFIEPYSYEWNGNSGYCERHEEKVVEEFVFANNDHNYYQTSTPNSRVKEIISYEEFDSISFATAKEMNLIVDVNDASANKEESACVEATLKLVPNNRK
jgi:hypothetical protein